MSDTQYLIIFSCINCDAVLKLPATAKNFSKVIYDNDLEHEKDCPDHRVFIKSKLIETERKNV